MYPHKPDWGRIVKNGRYLAVYCPEHPNAWSTGYIAVHRAVAEMMIGRVLAENEDVHHRDKNGHNNSPENLEILTDIEHARLHSKERPRQIVLLVCCECGQQYRRRKGQDPAAKGYKNSFCSRRCNGIHQRRKQLRSPSSMEEQVRPKDKVRSSNLRAIANILPKP